MTIALFALICFVYAYTLIGGVLAIEVTRPMRGRYPMTAIIGVVAATFLLWPLWFFLDLFDDEDDLQW